MYGFGLLRKRGRTRERNKKRENIKSFSDLLASFSIQQVPRNNHSNGILCYVLRDLENHHMEYY